MDRQELVKKLKLLKPALADNPLVTVHQCYQFTGKKVIAWNDEIGIVTPCRMEQPFAVNGEVLLGLLDNSGCEDVELTPTIHNDDNDLMIKAGRGVFKLPYFTEDEFLFEEPEVKDVVIPITDKLYTGLESCLTTVSRDTARPALMGICIHNDHDVLKLYSCDGDALTAYSTGTAAVNKEDVTLPTAFCEAVLRLMINDEPPITGELFLNKEWGKVTLSTGYEIYGRLLTLDNPIDHGELIKQTLKSQPKFINIPTNLTTCLSRARVIADRESAPTQLMVSKGGKLKIATESSMGVVKESIEIEAHHPEVVATISAELIHGILPNCDEMAIMENCIAFRKKSNGLFQLVSNLGD